MSGQEVNLYSPGDVAYDSGNPLPVTLGAGGSNFATSQVSVGTTATSLAAARPSRIKLVIQNLSTTPVYIGPAGVTTANGLLLPGTAGATLEIPTTAQVFGIVATGTGSVAVFETY